jgi:hypothetical protein
LAESVPIVRLAVFALERQKYQKQMVRLSFYLNLLGLKLGISFLIS